MLGMDAKPASQPLAGAALLRHSVAAPTLNAAQCALLLHCSQATVEELAARGELPATKFGRGWVFVTEQILEVLRTRAAHEADERKEAMKESTNRIRVKCATPAARSRPGRKRKAIPAKLEHGGEPREPVPAA